MFCVFSGFFFVCTHYAVDGSAFVFFDSSVFAGQQTATSSSSLLDLRSNACVRVDDMFQYTIRYDIYMYCTDTF